MGRVTAGRAEVAFEVASKRERVLWEKLLLLLVLMYTEDEAVGAGPGADVVRVTVVAARLRVGEGRESCDGLLLRVLERDIEGGARSDGRTFPGCEKRRELGLGVPRELYGPLGETIDCETKRSFRTERGDLAGDRRSVWLFFCVMYLGYVLEP